MDERVQHALEHDSLIDITTRGRKTGQRHRIEIRFHNLEGDLYLTQNWRGLRFQRDGRA
jgi:hypothetical protein